jgi:hypothetical protein
LLVGTKGSTRVEIGDDASLAAWLAGFPVVERARGFTAARELSAERVVARVSLGGKMGLLGNVDDQYEGGMPGIAEEAILTLERRGVYVPLAAFGGATRDVAIALGLLPEDQRVPRGNQVNSYHPAISRIAGMRDLIDAGLRGGLAALVVDDRAEEIGAALVRLLQSASNACTPARP